MDSDSNIIFEEMNCLVNILQSEMGQGMRVYGSTFLWFIPFVRSVMELTVVHGNYIGEIIHYLEKNIDKDVLSGRMKTCDKVSEFFIRLLVDIIELHLSKSCMVKVLYLTHIWVNVVVQCATLSGDFLRNKASDRRGVSSTTPVFSSFTRMPLTGIGTIRESCLKLIHSLLKEGVQTGTVQESTHFLKLLKKHMREAPLRGWILTRSESNDLEKCLKKVVQAISDRHETVPVIVPCAPPTPPTEPPENVVSPLNFSPLTHLEKKETKNAEDRFQFKIEPDWEPDNEGRSTEEPLTDFSSSLKTKPMKLDLGKIQEIRSKLKNDSKILAVVKGQTEMGRVIPQASTSQFNMPNSARSSNSGKKNCDDDLDDETLKIRDCHLKRMFKVSSESEDDVISVKKLVKTDCDTSVIMISDDEVLTNNARSANMDVGVPVSNPDQSPGRNYDDLSESQLFEFETQEYVASAWNDPFDQDPIKTKKRKTEIDRKEAVEPKSDLGNETEPVLDEDIEEACRQAEEQIGMEQMAPKSAKFNFDVSLKPKFDAFVKPTLSTSRPSAKSGVAEEVHPGQSRKSFLETLKQTVKQQPRLQRSNSHDCTNLSTSMNTSPPGSSKNSSVLPQRPTPLIVPPKKFRQPIEPKSAAELLGLKKKERKAFDLSQRSLDSLDELRSHGQNVHIKPKAKRVRRTSKPGPKLAEKVGKKMLASQDMQFFRQSRDKLKKLTSMSAVAIKPSTSAFDKKSKSKHEDEDAEVSEEDCDDFFLPCSQPDPDGSTENEKSASKDSGSFQSFDVAVENPPEQMEKNVEYDDEWATLTQNEPSDMELCSQMEEAYREYLITVGIPDQSKAPVPPKILPANNDHPLFLKPDIPPPAQKKTTTKIYTSSSRSASLAMEIGKPTAPLPVTHNARSKVARPAPAVPPPQPTQEFRSPPLPRIAPNPPSNQFSRPAVAHRSNPKPANQSNRIDIGQMYEQGFLKQSILKWEFRMLDNYEMCGSPDDLSPFPLKNVPTKFSSYTEYFYTFYPLLLINAFEEVSFHHHFKPGG